MKVTAEMDQSILYLPKLVSRSRWHFCSLQLVEALMFEYQEHEYGK
jgi:hypothetical protein